MTLRKRAYVAMVVWDVVVIGAIVASSDGGPNWLPLLLFPIAIVLGVYLLMLKCPQCRTSIFFRNWSFLGTKLPVWVGWPAHRCSVCGNEIT